ncbi:MAG: hypothetical protein ACRD8O_01345 [Bryobacteraceae bacterium]
MFDWLKSKLGHKEAPLTGAPPVRRQKTHSAQSGYVYQYYYEGHRGPEYVFDVSADRKTSFPVSVIVDAGAVRPWQQAHGRDLSQTELYAIAKMSLFKAFDERESPAAMSREIRVNPEDVDAILCTLDLD